MSDKLEPWEEEFEEYKQEILNINLKHCPMCGRSDCFEYRWIVEDDDFGCLVECESCGTWGNIKNWNTRPIEGALRARAEKAEEKLEQLERQIAWQGDEATKENARLSSAINYHRQRANKAEADCKRYAEINEKDTKSWLEEKARADKAEAMVETAVKLMRNLLPEYDGVDFDSLSHDRYARARKFIKEWEGKDD